MWTALPSNITKAWPRRSCGTSASGPQRFRRDELLILHRYGEIGIGDNIVLIIAGAEHRAEAFQACKWAIDELKQITPFGNSNTPPDGEVGSRSTHSPPKGCRERRGPRLRVSMDQNTLDTPVPTIYDRLGRPLLQPAPLCDRPLQSSVQVLYARGRLCLVAARHHPDV